MEILTDSDDWAGGILLGPRVEFKLFDTGGDGTGLVEGYGATFGHVDHGLDTIEAGAFADTLQKHRSAGTAPAMLWAHRGSEPIGKWTGMGEDARGLRVRGALNLNTPAGRKAHEHLKAGDVSSLSIGYTIPRGGVEHNAGGMRTLKKLDLHEVSVAPVPMDPHARVTSVKSIESVRDLEEALREIGFSKSDARKITAGGWPVLSGEPQENPHLAALGRALDASLADLKNLNLKGILR